MNEGYSPKPVPGTASSHTVKRSMLGGGWGVIATSAEDHSRYEGDETTRWGKFLALSVDIPFGMCPGGDGCSRLWMYGSEAWEALMERCRLAVLFEKPPGVPAVESLDVACAVGDRAMRMGEVLGITARHFCGVGPPEASFDESERRQRRRGESMWQHARVWDVRGLAVE